MDLIVIGTINLTRVRLGDAILLLSILRDFSEKKNIHIDFKKVCKILSKFSYINSFKNLEELAQDLVKKVSGKEIIFDFDEGESNGYSMMKKKIDSTVSINTININMLQYLNDVAWPTIINFLSSRMSKGKSIRQYCILNIPYCDIFKIYDLNENDEQDIFTKKTNASIYDIITWFQSNMIDFITPFDIYPNMYNLQVKFSFIL